jgi:branched-subunit amino acid ABC-type transport system permease component
MPLNYETVRDADLSKLAGAVAKWRNLPGQFNAIANNFTVTVVGGLGSVSGALLAGLLLGIVHTLSAFYIGAFFTFVILLLTAMVTILVRPSGLMGKATA